MCTAFFFFPFLKSPPHGCNDTTTAKKLRQLISCLQMYWHAQPVDAKSRASKMGYFGKHILFHFHTATLLDFIQVKLTLAGLDLALTMDRCAAVSCSFLYLLSFLYIWYYTKCGRKALFQSLIGKNPQCFLVLLSSYLLPRLVYSTIRHFDWNDYQVSISSICICTNYCYG